MEIHDLKVRYAAFGIFLSAFCILSPEVARSAVPDGYVVKVESATVYLDWGKLSGVQAGDEFSIYRPGEPLKHPVTGEVLGRTEDMIAKGGIESVEDKFSIGHLYEVHAKPQAGDRTRYSEVAQSSEAGAANTLPIRPSPEATAQGTVLKERWRSDPYTSQAVGLAVANLDGNGQKYVVIAFEKTIEVFRWSGQSLESVTVFKHKTYRHWVGIEAADLKHEGRDEIFASAFFDAVHRPRLVVLRLENGTLKQVGELEGFARVIDRADGSRTLAFQNMSRSRELSYTAPAELVFAKGSYKPGAWLKLSRLRDDQLFGYTLGDWDGDKSEDLAILERGENLRVFFSGVKWSEGGYGGTRDDFSLDSNDVIGSVYPRLLTQHRSGGKDELLVPRNIPELGVRLTYLKLYKKSELTALAWNGLEMTPAWKLPIGGYLADYAIGDGMHEGTPQLWLATLNPGDKTVILCYNLP